MDVQNLVQEVLIIETWLKTQLHLPEIMDRTRIRTFLRVNKGSIEKTKQKIDAYYTLRKELWELFSGGNPRSPEIQQLLDIVYWVALPKPSKEGYRVQVLKMRQPENWKSLDTTLQLVHILNSIEIRLNEDDILDTVTILDMDGVNWGFVLKYNPIIVLKYITALEKIYSMPLKAIYVIHAEKYVSQFVALLKTLMKPKLFERIHVLHDDSKLRELFPVEILPRDYGGSEKCLEELNELMRAKMLEYQERFDFLENMTIDERLRPTKLENDEFSGYHGSFRNISID